MYTEGPIKFEAVHGTASLLKEHFGDSATSVTSVLHGEGCRLWKIAIMCINNTERK